MAIIIKVSGEESKDALSINVFDNTGVYNATTNQGGYNSPNPAVADILTATLNITLPNSTVPITIASALVFPTLPNTSDTPFVVTASMLGLTTLPDGIYVISYTVTYAASPQSSTGQSTEGFVAVVNCCVQKKLAAVALDENCSCCDNSQAMKALEAYVDLCIARSAVGFGLTNVFNKYLTRLNKLCDASACNCG